MQPAIQNILMTTDLSDASWHALKPAVRWARHFDARLRVLQVNEIPVPTVPVTMLGSIPPPMTDVLEHTRKVAREAIEERLASTEVPFEVIQIDGAATSDLILEEAAKPDVDLLVMCTHGRTGMDRFWIGSVAERVIQRASCPVLTVHPETTQVDVPSVMLCTDLSPASWVGLPWAAMLARKFDVPLKVMSALEDCLYLTELGAGEKIVPVIREAEPVVKARIEQKLSEARVAGHVDGDQEVEILLRQGGKPWEVILEEASSPSIGLLVLGTRGLSGLPHVFLGSTAQRLVRRCSTPVLTVHGEQPE